MSSNSQNGASEARPSASRRFSDVSEAATTAFGRLFVSDAHARAQQAQSTTEVTETTTLPPTHTCSATECAISKVFETTELLELVLGFLGTQDVLRLRRTNRKWDGVTKKSPLLRLHYFVAPQWIRRAQDYQLLELNLPGLTISPGDAVDKGRWIEVSMTRAAARQISPNAGSRNRALSVHEGLRGLRRARETGNDSQQAQRPSDATASQLQPEIFFIVQPPIVGLQAFVFDSRQSDAGPSNGPERRPKPHAIAKIHCDTGITLGFLADAVQMLLRTFNEENVDTKQVLFKAIVSFSPPDATPKKRDGRRSIVRI